MSPTANRPVVPNPERHSSEQNSSARWPDPANAGKSLREAKYLGFLLFLQAQGELSEGQCRFVLRLQAKLNLDQIQCALRLVTKLAKSPRSLARARKELERVRVTCPSLPDKSIRREQRRVGVGYRDKGACRPSHRPVTERPDLVWWSEDIAPALLEVPEEPRLITAEELFGKDRYNVLQELALLQLVRNSGLFPNL